MYQNIDTRTLAIIALIAINVSVFILLRYRPNDFLPRSYDLLKWFALLLGINGVIILSNIAPVIPCFLLALGYLLAYKQCVNSIPDSLNTDDRAAIFFESVVFSAIAFLVAWATKQHYPFGAAIVVLLLAGYFACRLYFVYKRIQGIKDTQRKQRFIALLGKFSYPLAMLLCRYHPDWYPPPVNRVMASSIAKYATVLRDLDTVNGTQYSDTPDHELIRSSFSRRTFPEAWDYEKTFNFCYPIVAIADALKLCAELPLDVQTKYATELTDFFDARRDRALQAEDRLPPDLRDKINRILQKANYAETIEEEIARTDSRLTALIPDYMAKTHTVIGTPSNGLPIAYDSLETRYYHTFLIGRSGRGKSTVITNIVAQDMHKGYGVIVMSPDEDLMNRIVPYIPERRLDDVIYFDPGDTTSPIIGFNPLFLESLDDQKEYEQLRRRKIGETNAVLTRTLGIDTEPTRNLLNNVMYALIGRPNTTLSDLRRLIDPKERAFHKEIADDSHVDSETRAFWATYATEGANAMVYRNLIARMANLLRPPLFDIFSTHTISFHRELNERSRIVLIDLSSFSRDSLELAISAQLLIATIQQTMLRRDKMRKQDYLPYFMYIDEFQNFADTNRKSIEAMTEQLRKYFFGLTLTSLAASSINELLDTILGAMSNYICLGLSAKDAGTFAREMSIKHAGRDSVNSEALTKLQRGQAYVLTPPLQAAVFVNLPAQPPGNLPTLPTTIADLKKRSKANFGAMVKPSASAAVDSDTQNEHVAEPTDPPQAQKQPSRQTNRRKRTRFDEDAGDPLIEIS